MDPVNIWPPVGGFLFITHIKSSNGINCNGKRLYFFQKGAVCLNTMEFAILDFIQNNIRCGFLDFLMPKITALGNAGILWIILTVIFLISKKYRNTGIVMAAALILDLIGCNLILKPLVARERPFEINSAVNLLISAPKDYSFPSGHTAASFAAVGAMYFTKYKHWKIFGVIALIIAFSRLYLYVHFPTDVLFGALLGIACGFAAVKIYEAVSKLSKNRR